MSPLFLAFVLAVSTISALALLLNLIGLPKEVIGGLSTTVVGAIPVLREGIEKYRERKSGTPTTKILSFDGYAISWSRVVLYVLLGVVAIMGFSAALGGAAVALSHGSFSALPMLLIQAAVAWPVLYFIGRWAGRRGGGYSLAATILGVSFAVFSMNIVDYLIVSPDQWAHVFGAAKSWSNFLNHMVIQVTVVSVLTLLGFWRGTKQKLTSYLTYLVQKLPQDVRRTLIDIAFDETKNLHKAVSKKTAV